MVANDVWAALAAPFPASEVQWRVGSTNHDKSKGLALAYIDARSVMDRLDDVVGPGNWHDSYRLLAQTTMCQLSVRVDGEWITKEDGAPATDVEGEKGALSDALKRAAVKFGIFRYGYSLPSQWVELKDGKYINSPPSLPDWALPKKSAKATPAPAPTPAATDPAPEPKPKSDVMTDEQKAKFKAEIDKLANDYFDVFGKALANLYAPDLTTITSHKEAVKWYKAIAAECRNELAKTQAS